MMLVVSRQHNESINVGHDVVITVNSIKGNTVIIGVDAPKSMPVYRSKVYLALFGPNKFTSELILPEVDYGLPNKADLISD